MYSNNGEMFCDRLEGAGPGALERIWGHFSRTGLEEYLPYTYEVIDSLGAGKALARIEEIYPMSVMGWHNHVFELFHPETHMIIQVPVTIPEGFKYSVMSNKDYRTNDSYQGIIEEVRFINESSPDKNESGFGGLLLVTVRKM